MKKEKAIEAALLMNELKFLDLMCDFVTSLNECGVCHNRDQMGRKITEKLGMRKEFVEKSINDL